MWLVQSLILLAALVPGLSADPIFSAVYVKGHSRAAVWVRKSLDRLTCYSEVAQPTVRTGTLLVDHILETSGRSWIVMVLTDELGSVRWEAKAEEYPWPIRSPLERLLKQMAKSTCEQIAPLETKTASPPQAAASSLASQTPTSH